MNRISTTAWSFTYGNRLQAVSAAALVALVALTGASWLTIAAPGTDADVVKLERVVVSGSRTAEPGVAQLPRVVVEGRRTDGTRVASACTAPAVC